MRYKQVVMPSMVMPSMVIQRMAIQDMEMQGMVKLLEIMKSVEHMRKRMGIQVAGHWHEQLPKPT